MADDLLELIENEEEQYICFSPVQEMKTTPGKRKKPSVSASWAYSDINSLIMTVEANPCIWDYSCKEYKDRYKREQAWRQVQTLCPGHTVEDCKAKWANVKTAFQNVQKKMKSKSGQGAECMQPHWAHWNAMQFLYRHSATKCVSTDSTLDVEEFGPSTSKISENETPTYRKETPTREEAVNVKGDILQRAVNCLQSADDNWHVVGMYLSQQMRDIAKKNKKAASKLQFLLVKNAMDATLEVEDEE